MSKALSKQLQCLCLPFGFLPGDFYHWDFHLWDFHIGDFYLHSYVLNISLRYWSSHNNTPIYNNMQCESTVIRPVNFLQNISCMMSEVMFKYFQFLAFIYLNNGYCYNIGDILQWTVIKMTISSDRITLKICWNYDYISN